MKSSVTLLAIGAALFCAGYVVAQQQDRTTSGAW